MEFNRWNSKTGTSWVYKLFNEHHTLLNSLYWSYAPIESYCKYIYRHKRGEETTQGLLYATGVDAHRIKSEPKEWLKSFQEFDNWTRLNALVALLAYFEVYVSSVVSLAVESNPGLIFNVSRVIDGVRILKSNNQKDYSFYNISETITKGTWAKRIAAYRKTFGQVPTFLEDNIRTLERMRKSRNNIAHAFGRDIESVRGRGLTQVLESERLSLKSLKKYMEITEKIAKAIDEHLVAEHIGDYEIIYYFHQNQNKFAGNRREVALRRELNRIGINGTCDDEYCMQLISYYENI